MSKLIEVIEKLNGVGEVSFDVRKIGWDKLNEADYEKCVDVLMSFDAEAGKATHLHSNEYYHKFTLDGHKFTINFTKKPDNSQRIAELKRELAELER